MSALADEVDFAVRVTVGDFAVLVHDAAVRVDSGVDCAVRVPRTSLEM